MLVLLDTSTAECCLSIVDDRTKHDFTWSANRLLAKGLLKFIKDSLSEVGGDFQDISGIGAMKGPGSFTGLRIGLTVANTLADSLQVAIVGGEGADWQNQVIKKLQDGSDDKIVLPSYGSDPHITAPRK